jgi:hypothetical protein
MFKEMFSIFYDVTVLNVLRPQAPDTALVYGGGREWIQDMSSGILSSQVGNLRLWSHKNGTWKNALNNILILLLTEVLYASLVDNRDFYCDWLITIV